MSLAPPLGARLFYVLCFASGAAALGWQLVWSKLFAIGLGHEFPAALGVVSAFMAGMALGSFGAGRWMRRPGRFYLGCEVIIGLWGMLSLFLVPKAGAVLSHWLGLEASSIRYAAAAFVFPCLVLLPATAAMGATFPALEAWRAGEDSVRRVYAANTFGAVAGTLGAVFWVLPTWGLGYGAVGISGANFACAGFAWWLGRHESNAAWNSMPSRKPEPPPAAAVRAHGWKLGGHLAAAGFLAIAYEVLAIRLLAQVLENTVYSFAVTLAAYLAATAAGAWLVRIRCPSVLLALCGLTISTTALGIPILPGTFAWLSARLGAGLAEFLLALGFLGLPCALMGAVFARLVRDAKSAGTVARAVALNTLGAAAAPPLVGLWLLPWLQMKWSLALVSGGYVLLAWPRGLPAISVALFSIVPFFLMPAQVRILDRADSARVVVARDGPLSAVAVLEDDRGARVLRVNNRLQMGGTAAAAAQYRQAAIPLLLRPSARRALFLGTGTGITVGAAAQWDGLLIDAVELNPDVLGFVREFGSANFGALQRTNVHWHLADARRFVRETERRYDVIVADVFHPAQDGVGTLYTVEHFAAMRQCLAEGGLVCQWIPLHQVDWVVLSGIIRTFLVVYPQAEAWLLHFNVDIPVLGLIAGAASTPPGGRTGPEDLLRQLSLQDELRLLGHRVAGPAMLAEFATGVPLNTDLSQFVTFAAPGFRAGNHPRDTLLKLLNRARDAVVAPAALASYVRARDVYLRALADLAEQRTETALEGFVRSAALSPEFTGGYAQVLTFASMEAASNPVRARALLEQLIVAQPDRPAARQLLERLSQIPPP